MSQKPTNTFERILANTFERILADFKKSLTAEELSQFKGTTLKDVQQEIMVIQRQQAKTRTMRNMTRIKGFLEAMETYTKVFDVFVNVHDFVAFIWGPVKFLLLVASAFSDAFSGLLDAYQRIAQSLPLLEQYQSLFSTDAKVQLVLEKTFLDIFTFHQLALQYFRKPAWKQLFHATWSKFKTTFGAVVDDLKEHKALLIEQATLEQFRRMEDDRKIQVTRFKAQEEHERMSRRRHLAAWLSPADIRTDQDRGVQARQGHPNSCQWILRKEAFRMWQQGTAEPLLWIHGTPGCGKSVLASYLIDEAMKLSSTTVVYFYCRHNDPQRNSFLALAKSIIWELASHDDMLVDHLFEVTTKGPESLQLRTQKFAGKLLETAINAAGSVYVVLDGLDECSPLEQKHIVLWFRKYFDSLVANSTPSRCVFFSQHDATTKSLFPKVPTLKITTADTRADIGAYTLTWARSIERKFGSAHVDAQCLAGLVTERSEGMFLFARLAMNHLFDQTNPESLRTETSFLIGTFGPDDAAGQGAAGVFKNLYVVYSRIVESILVLAPEPHQRDAKQLLKWLVCAIRPLNWREIQSAFSIDLDKQAVNHDRRRKLDAKDLCGSLIEVSKSGEVELVHNTAGRYLEVMGHVHPPDDHVALATLCLEYFCLPALDPQLRNEDIDQYISDGAYGFLDYATACWAAHVSRGLQPRPSGLLPADALGLFEEMLGIFFDIQWQEPKEKLTVPRDLVNTVQNLRNADLHKRLLVTLTCMQKFSNAEAGEVTRYSSLQTLTTLSKIRERMEGMAANDPAHFHSTLDQFYGSTIYKCSRLYCKWFYVGFADKTRRQGHVEKHERTFYCPHEFCLSASIGLSSKKELEAHIDAYHKSSDDHEPRPSGSRTFECPDCPASFTRSFNLRTHMRRHTGEKGAFECTKCKRAFAAKSLLKRHDATVHDPKRKFGCDHDVEDGRHEACFRRFHDHHQLSQHLGKFQRGFV